MFERFSDRARKVMALANAEAQRLNHGYIGTEHILLGLVKEDSGVGANVLKNLGIDPGRVYLEVERLLKSGPDTVTMGRLPETPQAKKVIAFAIEEARNLKHSYVGTEHLLLGLLRTPDSVAELVLTKLGLTLEDARREVCGILGERPPILQGEHKVEETRDLPARFSDRAQKVMALANAEAKRLNHEYLGTEDILLGLVKEGTGVGANVLKNLGIDFYKVRSKIERLVKSNAAAGKLPQGPRAKSVLMFAIEESRAFNHNYVGTEHLLLGLLRAKEGVAAEVLTKLGLKLEEVREEVRDLLGMEPDSTNPTSADRNAARRADSSPARAEKGLGDGKSFEGFFADDEIAKLLESLLRQLAARKEQAVLRADYERAAAYRDLMLAAVQLRDQLVSVLAREQPPEDKS